jgi:hypothetical protein
VTSPGQFTSLTQITAITPGGTVAFAGVFTDLQQGVLTGDGTGTTVVVTTAGSPYNGLDSPSINASNQLGIRAGLNAGGQAILFGTAGNVAPVVDTSGQFDSFGASTSITSTGTIAFQARLDNGSNGAFTVTPAGAVTTIADSTGPYATFGNVSISPNGRVAFLTTLDAGGSGIFTGPNLTTDRVIQTGDSLDGSTVTGFEFSQFAINDSGAVVFGATLADGRQGIYVATPIPEPGGVLLLAAVAGAGLGWRRLARRGCPGSEATGPVAA